MPRRRCGKTHIFVVVVRHHHNPRHGVKFRISLVFVLSTNVDGLRSFSTKHFSNVNGGRRLSPLLLSCWHDSSGLRLRTERAEEYRGRYTHTGVVLHRFEVHSNGPRETSLQGFEPLRRAVHITVPHLRTGDESRPNRGSKSEARTHREANADRTPDHEIDRRRKVE
jgi:hypothetical protein